MVGNIKNAYTCIHTVGHQELKESTYENDQITKKYNFFKLVVATLERHRFFKIQYINLIHSSKEISLCVPSFDNNNFFRKA